MTRDISKLIEAINRVGIQNVSLLSRMSGMPTETVRYTMKKRFPNLGLSVRTPVNYSALGLERYFVSLRLADDGEESESTIFKALSTRAFLTYRCDVATERRTLAFFAVPVSVVDDFKGFLDELVSKKILAEYRIERFDWSRHPELKSKYYNFAKGEWSINWDKIRKSNEAPPPPMKDDEPSPTPDIDETDLLIIKELELDAWRNIAEIARDLGINDRTARWHFTKHVSGVAQAGYVKWVHSTPKEYAKAIGLIHEFNDLSKDTLSKLRLLFNNFPFAWFEGGRNGGYYQVHSAIPAAYFMESMRYLNGRMGDLVDNWRTWTVDLSSSLMYTIPYESFDNKLGWTFDKEKAVEAITSQALKPKAVK